MYRLDDLRLAVARRGIESAGYRRDQILQNRQSFLRQTLPHSPVAANESVGIKSGRQRCYSEPKGLPLVEHTDRASTSVH